MRRLAIVLGLLGLLGLLGCAPRPALQGRARVVTWTPERVIRFCSSGRQFQLGVSTSNAMLGLREVERWIDEDPTTPVIVEISGASSSLASGEEPAPGVDGVMSIGTIAPVARATSPDPGGC